MTHNYCIDCGQHVLICRCPKEEDMMSRVPVDKFMEDNNWDGGQPWRYNKQTDGVEFDRLCHDMEEIGKSDLSRTFGYVDESTYDTGTQAVKCSNCDTVFKVPTECFDKAFVERYPEYNNIECPFCFHKVEGGANVSKV